MEEFELIAKTFQGLEEVLAKELVELGANNVQIGRRMVSFTGDKEMMYKANFCLRTAIRILKPIAHFKASSADEVYEKVKAMDWDKYMDWGMTFSVDSVVYSDIFRHSKFVAYRVKDAIADHFNEKCGKRPSVRLNNPDLIFHIHIAQEECTLAFDSSGESLHRRGYREETGAAPINEVLAAGLILLTGWRGECDFVDPMCGSGTIPIEAALIARNIAPGVYRKGFAFEKWRDFDSELFSKIYDDDSQEKEFHHKIYGYDVDGRMVGCARRNIKSAMMSDYIEVDCRDIKDFEPMENRAIMVVNPPYGERLLSDKLLETYKTLGSRLKHAFSGNEAWIISSNYECFDQIGLKASARIALFNGDLDCEFRKFELFQGKYSGFRDEGKSLQKDFAPLKRRSRLTGLDGETKESRRQRESYENMTEEEIAAAKRRRQLESYLGGRAGRKSARPRREERDEQGADKKPARGERPARKEFTPGRDNRRPAAKGGYAGKPSQRRSGGDKGGYRRNNKK
ncbi:MAG: RNA methyltransferase [Bacteroidales bacterium]|nr:RNA methyltransferase [Bacteroidales bacterium]